MNMRSKLSEVFWLFAFVCSEIFKIFFLASFSEFHGLTCHDALFDEFLAG